MSLTGRDSREHFRGDLKEVSPEPVLHAEPRHPVLHPEPQQPFAPVPPPAEPVEVLPAIPAVPDLPPVAPAAPAVVSKGLAYKPKKAYLPTPKPYHPAAPYKPYKPYHPSPAPYTPSKSVIKWSRGDLLLNLNLTLSH